MGIVSLIAGLLLLIGAMIGGGTGWGLMFVGTMMFIGTAVVSVQRLARSRR